MQAAGRSMTACSQNQHPRPISALVHEATERNRICNVKDYVEEVRETKEKPNTNIKISQHNIKLPLPPRLPLAEILSPHSLRPQRKEFFRIRPHPSPMTRMISQLLERREHCCRPGLYSATDETLHILRKGRKGRKVSLHREGDLRQDIHIVPVRFKPKTMTSIGRVRIEGNVSTRRGSVMLAVAQSSQARLR